MIGSLFNKFTSSEKSSGVILIVCTLLSLLIANSFAGAPYTRFWHMILLSKPLEFWINDGLMTLFFLLVGLEIKRELIIGELATVKKAMLPVIAAIGGMLVPALIHFIFNKGTAAQNGFGVPMATDIAFSLAILSLLGKRIPLALKIFLTALAIIDDLGAIIIIALFYSKSISFIYLGAALLLFGSLLLLKKFKINSLLVYLPAGMLMWFCIYRSGIHPTITGVLLAFAIPFGKGDERSASAVLQERLHLPVAFLILPLFALVNTAIIISPLVIQHLSGSNSFGIIFGLVAGKPIGIFSFAMLGVVAGWCTLPQAIKKRHLLFTGMLAGIGFTMSIFISLLAFTDAPTIDTSKVAVMIGSLISAIAGYLGLRFTFRLEK